MPHYRVYFTTTDGHVTGPATVIECTDDQKAIGKAANGTPMELWEGADQLEHRPIQKSPTEPSAT
jgi:hypothetical protein